ncbi:hypothetical protein SK571_36850 [Lentzea sp. BCCO 10_0798]|uniref:Leucine rich repeat variant n=1 Tax=Lentzea kristufekii TaxID=3095430 RepID=A0ABU4U4C9_9PSEU|nr:hypothetical protein [Lentzea sp. BCCO 10_0798]MDX8054972.1 hypothetical protein [Lentzea sp. BCCO 10_0798]
MHLQKALEGLALNPALPEGMVRRLIAHRRGFGDVAARPDLTGELIDEIIAGGEHRLLHTLALNRALPDPVRLRLARHPDASVRSALVKGCDQGAAREVFELLLADPEPQTRAYLAQSDALPDDLRESLATDPSPQVRAALGRWWTEAPEHVRRLLLTDAEDEVRAAACATYHSRFPHPVPPPDLVPALIADPVTRAGAVRHLRLDAATAARLAADPDPEVRAQLARHPQLPPELRDVLGTDPSGEVRLGVYARQDTPEPLRTAIHAWFEAAPHPIDVDPDLDDEEMELALVRSVLVIELHMMRLEWVMADPLSHIDSPYPCFRASAAATREPLPPTPIPGCAASPRATPTCPPNSSPGWRPIPTTRCGARSPSTATSRSRR